jgi:hypothetical protein
VRRPVVEGNLRIAHRRRSRFDQNGLAGAGGDRVPWTRVPDMAGVPRLGAGRRVQSRVRDCNISRRIPSGIHSACVARIGSIQCSVKAAAVGLIRERPARRVTADGARDQRADDEPPEFHYRCVRQGHVRGGVDCIRSATPFCSTIRSYPMKDRGGHPFSR